ncbi:hypothetical protein HHI36_004672 [Cryptolaemus montrouzieri]|uniref:Uncharacterized protein n=1 Tax=Cryptolaemus montrouzieri TaxID=559131 RepID=A0ABD2NRY1_9CUCU
MFHLKILVNLVIKFSILFRMNSNSFCKCVYCFEKPKGQLNLCKLPPGLFPWQEKTKLGNASLEKLILVQEDIVRLLQWKVISYVYKSVHPESQKREYDCSVTSFVHLSPNVINYLFSKLTEELLPTNFVHQAFCSVSSELQGTRSKSISYFLANMLMHPVIEFLAFGPCCYNNSIDLNKFFPNAAINVEEFIELLRYITSNICHKPNIAILTSNKMVDCQEDLGILTIYKQDTKDCITGYCAFSKSSLFERLKNYKERIKPYTNPTTFTITFRNERFVLMTTLEVIKDILHLNSFHTPIEFVVSVDDNESHTFTNGLVYKGVNKKAFTISMKKQAPLWCKNYIKYLIGAVSLMGEMIENERKLN